jgi:hypothetical protein
MFTHVTSDPLLKKLLASLRPQWQFIFENPERYRLQFIYTRIDRDAENRPHFSHHPFGVDRLRYFYPASLVKLPVAALALEKINDLSIPGLGAETPLRVVATPGREVPYDRDDDGNEMDPVAPASSIKRMLVASDNGGYNRLWEFLTRDRANGRLAACGFGDIRLLHRLCAGCSPAENRVSNPIRFCDDAGRTIYEQPGSVSSGPDTNPLAPVSFGRAFVEKGEIRTAPFKADYLNYAPLDDLHRFLIAIISPGGVPPEKALHLTEEDYLLLRTWMGRLPGESGMVRYAGYPDNFKKFFLFGSSNAPLSPTLREYNVAGRAYGFLSDLAYLADTERDIEFFLSATIYVNANERVNDDVYEYDTIGRPFFAALCGAVYDYEGTRERRSGPDCGE